MPDEQVQYVLAIPFERYLTCMADSVQSVSHVTHVMQVPSTRRICPSAFTETANEFCNIADFTLKSSRCMLLSPCHSYAGGGTDLSGVLVTELMAGLKPVKVPLDVEECMTILKGESCECMSYAAA